MADFDLSEQSVYEVIDLQPLTIALDEVTIKPEEEERATEMMRPPPGEPLFIIGYQGEQKEVKPDLGSPVSLLYYLLSKRGKEIRKLEKVKEQERIAKLVDDRFLTKEFLELTGFSGEEVLAFREHCMMSDAFVIYSTDYEFLVKVQNCLKTYKK